MKTVSIPGATLCPTSWGLMILKYGESVWVTLTRRATYKVKKNTSQYLSLSLISYPVQFNQHLLKQTLHYTADIKSNPNQFKLCVNLIFPKVASPHSTKKLALHSSKSAQTYFIQYVLIADFHGVFLLFLKRKLYRLSVLSLCLWVLIKMKSNMTTGGLIILLVISLQWYCRATTPLKNWRPSKPIFFLKTLLLQLLFMCL